MDVTRTARHHPLESHTSFSTLYVGSMDVTALRVSIITSPSLFQYPLCRVDGCNDALGQVCGRHLNAFSTLYVGSMDVTAIERLRAFEPDDFQYPLCRVDGCN